MQWAVHIFKSHPWAIEDFLLGKPNYLDPLFVCITATPLALRIRSSDFFLLLCRHTAKYSRNAHKWCAVIRKPGSARDKICNFRKLL